jgi:sugar O-acyltransferase (sialic acid O-acetyltransferase NeuD family)
MSGLLLIGGGGHCSTVIESLQDGIYEKIGIIDKIENIGKLLSNVPFVGCDNDLEILSKDYGSAFISLGGISDWKKREYLAQQAERCKYSIPSIIHPMSVVSKTADISKGVLLGAMCVINAHTKIGEMCILNTGCIVEHDCVVEAYVHVSPGAILCGGVRVGKGSHIGAGSVVKEGVSIGENTLIGIGSVVTRDIPSNAVAYGNPCKVIRQLE